MAIQTVTVPNPAAGAEWAYTIPGQYVATLIGIQATLTTSTPPSVLADSSGNGRTAAVNANWPGTFGNAGPFGGGANNFAAVSTVGSTAPGAYAAARTNADMSNSLTAMSVCYWARMDAQNATGANWGLVSNNPGASINWEWDDLTGGGSPWDLRYSKGSSGIYTITNVANVGTWVHIAHTWDNTSWRTYVNGTLVDTHLGDGPSSSGTPNMDLCGSRRQTSCPIGAVAAIAYWTATTLTAGNISSIAAAGTAAAYVSAVNALSPTALWMMNETNATAARTVTLAVQNGAATVATVPTPTITEAPGIFHYSWQVLGPGAAVSVDGTAISVPIPAMTLPPGYTIGSNTLDLQSTDRWSQITLWYDDGTGTPTSGGANESYLDALLVPNDWVG